MGGPLAGAGRGGANKTALLAKVIGRGASVYFGHMSSVFSLQKFVVLPANRCSVLHLSKNHALTESKIVNEHKENSYMYVYEV